MLSHKERILDIIRRAAKLTYVHGRSQMDLGELASALNHDAISPSTLALWADEDGWEAERRAAQGGDEALREQAERQKVAARKSLESLHNQALRVQRVLKPKTWEAAAGIQMRCAETLRHWADEDMRRVAGDEHAGASKDAPAAAEVPEAWRNLTDEDWQALAHAALRKQTAEGEKLGE